MRSSISRPTALSANDVTTAVSKPKHRLSPRATVYSPPPSQTSKRRVVAMRRSPGSNRSMTSPSASKSQRTSDLGLMTKLSMPSSLDISRARHPCHSSTYQPDDQRALKDLAHSGLVFTSAWFRTGKQLSASNQRAQLQFGLISLGGLNDSQGLDSACRSSGGILRMQARG